jgi:nanoRNase/pAp phosphatase (c-di-AMP/oligoRNAs hydrolase)
VTAALERRAFHEFVGRTTGFLLTTHINPDGDGLGSEWRLALWLRRMGKTVRSRSTTRWCRRPTVPHA